MNDFEYNDLSCKIDKLQKQLYLNAYKVKLPAGKTFTLNSSKHKMIDIRGYTFLAPNGSEVEIVFTLLGDKTVKIDSNIDLLNSTLILF